MTKEAALIQQITATDEAQEQLPKTRYRVAKKEYQEHLRKKNLQRKTLPKHKIIILQCTHLPSESHSSSGETDEEDLLEQVYETPDVMYDRSSEF